MTDKSRMMVRLTPEDLAWVEEQAADEGVDNATFVRMVINRLRRGRPPLMVMALEGHSVINQVVERPSHQVGYYDSIDAGEAPKPWVPQEGVEKLLIDRLAGVEPDQPQEPVANGAAVSLRHVDRVTNNPGRS